MIKFLFFFIFFIISCSTIKDKGLREVVKIETDCPENGECSFEILQNKSFEIKEDGIGKVFYELKGNLGKDVYHFKYSDVIKDPTLQDAGYHEEIVFEIEKGKKIFNYSDDKLQSVQMLFGVFCYCKGKAGFYEVRKGNVKRNKSTLELDIPKIVENQKINKIKISLY